MKELSKELGLKESIPGSVPMSLVLRVEWVIVQLIMSVVIPSIPVMRVLACRVSSRWVFFGFQNVDDHGIYGVEPFAVEGLSVGKPRDESFGRLRCGDMYAQGSTCVRLIVAGPVFSGGGPSFDVFEGGVTFDFRKPLGCWPPRLDRVPSMLEQIPIRENAPCFA